MILGMKEDAGGLSYRAIGAAMECHRELGPGLNELFYHELLRQKLKAAGIKHQFKPTGQLFHRDLLVDQFEADLIIGDDLDLELKALWGTFAPEHLLQIICYLKFWRLRAGLLIDFGKESLVVRRIQFTPPAALLRRQRVGPIRASICQRSHGTTRTRGRYRQSPGRTWVGLSRHHLSRTDVRGVDRQWCTGAA